MEITVILTCFNRKEKTQACIRELVEKNAACSFTFVVVDDNSSDGTVEVLQEMKKEYDICLLQSDGNAYYSGGMRIGMKHVLYDMKKRSDYVLIINDDVSFFDQTIEEMIRQSRAQKDAVIVGATCDDAGALSYSAIRYIKGISYEKLSITQWESEADTFNANCVLIPYEAFQKTGYIDEKYIHSLGDFDYGLELKRKGYVLHVSRKYVGICNNNPSKNTWTDSSLSRRERLKKKESIKGAPAKQWFYFLNKNFGLLTAIKGSITPYIRIMLKK